MPTATSSSYLNPSIDGGAVAIPNCTRALFEGCRFVSNTVQSVTGVSEPYQAIQGYVNGMVSTHPIMLK